MALVDVAGQAHDRTARVRTPVGGEQARERRDEVDAAVVLDGGRQFTDVGGFDDHPQVVAQPLHERARHGDRALERVNGRLVADLVGDCREEAVVGEDGLGAGVHEHEASGAVGVFGHALLEARLAEGRGLLVAQDARDGRVDEEAVLAPVAVDLGGGLDLGEHRHGDAEDPAHVLAPGEGADVHEHGARGVRDVRAVDAAVDAPRHVPQDPGVRVAEQQIAGLGALARPFDVVQDPLDLGAGEVGGQPQAADLAEAVRPLVAPELLDHLRGAHVLPDDRVVDGLSGVLVPHDGGLALVGDADGGQLVAVDLRLAQGLGDDRARGVPDLEGVVLDPPRVGEDLGELLLADGDDLAGVVEDDGAGGGRALVDGQNEFLFGHGRVSLLSLRCGRTQARPEAKTITVAMIAPTIGPTTGTQE